MYRLLREVGENRDRDRRRQRTHPARTDPQLLACEPNQVWSWDLIKLPGPGRAVVLEAAYAANPNRFA